MVNCCQPVTTRDNNELDTTHDREREEDNQSMNGPRASARNDGIMKPKNGEKSGQQDNLVVVKNVSRGLKKSKFSIPF